MHALVATDLSEAGVLSVQALLACNATLFPRATLLHVVDLDLYTAGGSIPQIVDWAQARLAEEAGRLGPMGFEVDFRVEQGRVAEMVEDVAREIGADLVVITDLGKGARRDRILGSTAERIAAAGVIPALVDRVHEREGAWCRLEESSPLSRPYVAVELDDSLSRLTGLVAGLLSETGVRIAHVLGEGVDSEQARRDIERAAAEKRLSDAEVVVLAPGGSGDVAETLVADAEEWGASVIVLGRHQQGLLSRVVFGSVAGSVLRGTRLPLLFV
jgi:nucleotide-binding universal stress UspA family protein